MAKPKTLDEAKQQARELARRGNDLRWKVSAGKLIDSHGYWVPSIRFQAVSQVEHFEDGSVFEPVASYTTYARNPTGSAVQKARDAERKALAAELGLSALELMINPVGDRNDAEFIAFQLRRGNVYVGTIEGGETATAAPFQGGYALFIERRAHGEGTAEQVASKLVEVSRPGSVRLGTATIENPAGIPQSVERYYEETLEQSPDMPTGKAWAVAWSRYCAYKRPDSPHCKMRRADYFPGRRGKGKRGADKIPAAQIELVRERHKGFDSTVLVRDSGTDVWKKAQEKLQQWARSVPDGETENVSYRVTFQDGEAIEGVVHLTGRWSQGHTLQEAVKAHAMFSAGRGAPQGWTRKKYAKALERARDAEFWKALLSEYDLGDSRPHLPVRL
jgi:hypothetical protein